MEKSSAKFFLFLFAVSFLMYIGLSAARNMQIGMLLEFGTIQFRSSISPEAERNTYQSIAALAVYCFAVYPVMIISAYGFVRTTNRVMKEDGWLLMSAILLFVFIPVELYSFWLDWKLVGLNYWGTWPMEEFRKALLARLSALGGLPFVAQLCYYSIPFFIIFKPLQKKTGQ